MNVAFAWSFGWLSKCNAFLRYSLCLLVCISVWKVFDEPVKNNYRADYCFDTPGRARSGRLNVSYWCGAAIHSLSLGLTIGFAKRFPDGSVCANISNVKICYITWRHQTICRRCLCNLCLARLRVSVSSPACARHTHSKLLCNSRITKSVLSSLDTLCLDACLIFWGWHPCASSYLDWPSSKAPTMEIFLPPSFDNLWKSLKSSSVKIHRVRGKRGHSFLCITSTNVDIVSYFLA